MRQRDQHIMAVDNITFISDNRFEPELDPGTKTWYLNVYSASVADAGVYECQLSTNPKKSLPIRLHVSECQIKAEMSFVQHLLDVSSSKRHRFNFLAVEMTRVYVYYEDKSGDFFPGPSLGSTKIDQVLPTSRMIEEAWRVLPNWILAKVIIGKKVAEVGDRLNEGRVGPSGTPNPGPIFLAGNHVPVTCLTMTGNNHRLPSKNRGFRINRLNREQPWAGGKSASFATDVCHSELEQFRSQPEGNEN
ncbi:unnamed protein product [Notodromas monacha]|uniref:Ig-like domain-containing protein n=1 Tax=Notodromas monacha TaxID=399045 RepID=A0A7R9BL03_9CRUS|nr:unnamed protein product [Notodromas monacha]CAG0916585.1 unnamed protein product [Notodromas monacha]